MLGLRDYVGVDVQSVCVCVQDPQTQILASTWREQQSCGKL